MSDIYASGAGGRMIGALGEAGGKPALSTQVVCYGQVSSSPRQPAAFSSDLVRALAAQPDFAQLPLLVPGSKAERRRKKAPAKRANILNPKAVALVEAYILEHSRSQASDLLKFRLSLRAGLRAGEIAALRVADMLAANGTISQVIEVRTLKKRSKRETRRVDMHPDIHEALALVLERHPTAEHAAFSIGRTGELRPQIASCVTNWFSRLYRNVGLLGCSSHSGRRTFATEVARALPAEKGSLRDLQIVMGHARIASTEAYLDPSNAMRRIIMTLGS